MMDFNRFERQMKLKEIGAVVQQKWGDAKVLVIGVGGWVAELFRVWHLLESERLR